MTGHAEPGVGSTLLHPEISVAEAGGVNVLAFLDVLAWCEIGDAMLSMPETDCGYRVLVGSTPQHLRLMDDYADHPMPTDDMAIEYAPGLYSTAAGRYQILNTYWPHYKAMLNLPDFSPMSQDKYAVQQLREQGALDALLADDLSEAVSRTNNIWASLPGSPYGQHTHSLEQVSRVYEAAKLLLGQQR